MIEEKGVPIIDDPSRKRILTASAVAFLVALCILFIAILPAEYGIDPLGTGNLLGLTDLANASADPAILVGIVEGTIMPVLQPGEQPSRWGDSAVVKGAFIPRPNRYSVDSRQITLQPGEGMEIKYNMQKGSGFVYSWVASGKVLYDFHGEPDVKPEGKEDTEYFESYDRDDAIGKDQFEGTFVAPSTGIHGWYWENTSDDVVTIKLVTAGFYDWIFQNVNDEKSRLKTIDAYSLPSHPTIPDELIRSGEHETSETTNPKSAQELAEEEAIRRFLEGDDSQPLPSRGHD
jgi:hypothetical protein